MFWFTFLSIMSLKELVAAANQVTEQSKLTHTHTHVHVYIYVQKCMLHMYMYNMYHVGLWTHYMYKLHMHHEVSNENGSILFPM